MKVLCVAEKPSIAKAVAGILSQHVSNRATANKYTRNYDCTFTFPGWGQCDVTVTSVAGHLFSTDFPQQYRSWHSCTPAELFEARIVSGVSDNMKDVHDNIVAEARHSQVLFIWTDCDREGEYIGWEVMTAAQKSNRNIQVKRANFNNLERAHILQAARNPINLDMRQVDAVAARIELDLRTGAAFTRLQTLQLQSVSTVLEKKVISYGSCQYPTLGFVVDRWRKVTAFQPEPYWGIQIKYKRDGIEVDFKWKRGVLYDRLSVVVLYSLIVEAAKARIVSIQQSPKSRWRPLPLTTVELQKQGTKYLRMSSAQIMDHAEKLYQKGFISYPRTETDQFDKGMDLRALIAKQVSDDQWGTYAQSLLSPIPPATSAGFQQPRNGRNNDKAHPPIHPIAHVTRSACASPQEHKVYEFVTRRFLAACSEDARGQQTEIILEAAGERFSAHGLMVTHKNYLLVYPYDKWDSTAQLPSFTQGELIAPDECKMTTGKTTRPQFLSEPELIGLMDVNGIGTDATMASHIETIVAREYALKQPSNTTRTGSGTESGTGTGTATGAATVFVPTSLGVGLVTGLESMGFSESLCKPHLRKETERQLKRIHDGTAGKLDVVARFVDEYRAAYLRVERNIAVLKQCVKQELDA